MRTTVIIVLSILMAGCVNLDLRSMVPNQAVKPTQTGYDCVYQWGPIPIIIGTNTAEKAMASAGHDEVATTNLIDSRGKTVGASSRFVSSPISKVHSIEVQQRLFLFFYNEICIQVTGE